MAMQADTTDIKYVCVCAGFWVPEGEEGSSEGEGEGEGSGDDAPGSSGEGDGEEEDMQAGPMDSEGVLRGGGDKLPVLSMSGQRFQPAYSTCHSVWKLEIQAVWLQVWCAA